MKPILNLEKIKELESKLLEIVTSDWLDLHTSYLEKEDWVGVPTEEHPYYVGFEDESFYDDSFFEEKKYITTFANSLQKAGYQSLYVLTEVVEPPKEHCFELETTKESILNFDYKYDNYLYSIIAPKDISFVILWVEDYSIIAGKKEFVEGLIGCDLETAMDVLKEDANLESYDFLKPMYEKYKAHNEKILRKLGGG